MERYLDIRKRQGFNTILVNLIEHKAGKEAPRNAYGVSPFAEKSNFARPSEAYFVHVDWVLQQAAKRDFLVLLAPSYLGFEGGDEGWYQEMRRNGASGLRAYGNYLGVRYRNLRNVIWVHGGDYNPPDLDLVKAVMDGIKEGDPESLHTFHGKRGTSARVFLGENTRLMDLNNIYTDENGVVAAAQAEYAYSNFPFFLIEGRYESMGATPSLVRTQAYQAVLSGACGQVSGNKYVWPFLDGWEEALESPGARSMAQMRKLLTKLRWSEFHPDDLFLRRGEGTGPGRAVAAIAGDGHRWLVYVPSQRELGLDLRKSRPKRLVLAWIDPVNGDALPVERRAKRDADGSILVTTPGRNSAGDEDWLLIAEH